MIRRDNWCGYRFPDHVNYFTPESLQKIVKKLGFEVAQFGLFDRLIFSDNMYIVLKKPVITTNKNNNQQAEAQAEAFADAVDINLATKQDIKDQSQEWQSSFWVCKCGFD